jgi:hypothetical protein
MTAVERENLRLAILKVSSANLSRFGLGVAAFKLHVAAFGFDQVSVSEVRAEVDYLVEKQLLAEVAKHLSPENRLWRISASGRDFLAEREA